MAQEIDQMCFDNLDEFVNDENKLVTYKWLSRTLSLHVNQAKQMLYTFVEQQRNKKDNDHLCVTYFLAGMGKDLDSSVYKVQIVPEERLESTKSTYSVLTSCHIYSIIKGKLKDTNSLYTADYDTQKEHILRSNQHSAITCCAAKLRTEDELDKISRASIPVQKPDSAPAKPVSKPPPEKSSKEKKPAGIAGMFAKSAAKSTEDNKQTKPESKDETNKTQEKDVASKGKVKPKQGAMMNFFSKQAEKPKQDSKDESITEKAVSPKKESPQKSCPPKTSSTKTEPADTKKGKKNKAESDDEDPVGQQKKRRRIKQQIVESSSEDEMEVEEAESPIPPPPPPESDSDEIPPTPSPKPRKHRRSPSPSPTKPASSPAKPAPSPAKEKSPDDSDRSGKVRKRKLVSKTFVNDEGFMVTEKVFEDTWEDAPEAKKPATETDKKPAPKSKKASPPTKKPSPNKGSSKQTSMMSFFQKK